MVGESVPDVIGGEAFARVEATMRQALAGAACSFECDMEVRGRRLHNLIHYLPDRDEDGVVHGFYSMVLDLTDRRAAELALARSEQRLRMITDNLPVLIAYVDRDERYQFCNGTYKEWLGQSPEQIVGRRMVDVLGERVYEPRRALVQRTLAGERVDLDVETGFFGEMRHLHTTYLPDVGASGATEGFYVLVSDITAMKVAEQRLAHQARTDALTELPNRFAFNEKLVEALARSRRNERPIALFFLDVDKFKKINDTLGHGAGDEVLQEFGRRLKASVRETDTVARLAGDEFVVILENLHTPAEPQFIARKVLAAINRPFEVAGTKLDVTTSIGIAYQSDGRAQPAELVAAADKALYEAKEDGRNTFRVTAA
jgi:diguanylate cyclase (GGDEF)-like protein/PAS domain S-box-containing protein